MSPHAPRPTRHRWRTFFRWLSAILFIAAGLNHFRSPGVYRQIVPPGFPAPDLLVLLSGVFEVAGGVGLLIRPLRRTAGWGLIALLVAVFPANIYMAVSPNAVAGLDIPPWALYVRLPLQFVFIAAVWAVACRPDRPPVAATPDQSRDR